MGSDVFVSVGVVDSGTVEVPAGSDVIEAFGVVEVDTAIVPAAFDTAMLVGPVTSGGDVVSEDLHNFCRVIFGQLEDTEPVAVPVNNHKVVVR